MKLVMQLLLATLMTLSSSLASANGDMVHRTGDVPAEARGQLATLAQAIARFHDVDVADAEGWTPFGDDVPMMGQHWSHPAGPDYVTGDVLDFSRPSNLIYSRIGDRKVLTGVAYIVRLGPDDPLPAGFAGTGDVWHVHDMDLIREIVLEDRPLARWFVNRRISSEMSDGRTRLAMVHAWVTLPNPDGPFASHNRVVSYMKLGLPPHYAEGASMEAARGVALATEKGCSDQFDGKLWIANSTRAQRRTILQACTLAAVRLRRFVDRGPEVLNAQGEAEWQALDRLYHQTLEPAQIARVTAMSQYEAGHAH